MEANIVMADPFEGVEVWNDSDVPSSEVIAALRSDQRLMAQLAQWSGEARGQSPNRHPARRQGGLLERDRYVTPDGVYEQMRLACDAVESDDVVGGVAESTESLALDKVSFYANDNNEQDVYNQLARDLDLDSRLREMWHDLFVYSQFYCAIWWGNKTYKVRGKTEKGNERRKSYELQIPEAITMLDPLKIVPVGLLMFNREQLAYIASREEDELFDDPKVRLSDPIISRLLLGRYTPTDEEKKWLHSEGVAADRLWRMNPKNVFRHTLTRPQYRRLAAIRMKSVFELLDMKHQLRSMDRAHLIGGTNFIVLVKKGSDEHPGKPEEIVNLQQNVKTLARLPVIVGDHRLAVEIVTPKLDTTLSADRYGTLDARITARLFGMFVLGRQGGSVGTSADDSTKLVKMIARGMESRRHGIRRTLEANVFGPILSRNEGALTTPMKLRFHPKNIALGFDAALANFFLELRQSNELSRETLHSQFDIDQDDEAAMLERERDEYDEIFQTQVPFSSPNPRNDPGDGTDEPVTPAQKRSAGRKGGGTRNGGGAAPGSGQGQPPRKPRKRSD